jgi:hypothetical protein
VAQAPVLVFAQLGGAVVAQFLEFGAVGVLIMVLALIINGTFRLRREVNGYREERDYWMARAKELEARCDQLENRR